jgi:thiamine-phosphate pyrophosphorylase
MRLIAITLPEMTPGEDRRIAALLSGDEFWRVHVRKPEASADDLRHLLDSLPVWCLPRLVLHDHFELCREYGIGGLHLNHRNPDLPPALQQTRRFRNDLKDAALPFPRLTLSCSCHSLDEVQARKPQMDYLFLSPVFDSISKQGYHARFSTDMLRRAAAAGIIDNKVFALGGVTLAKVPLLRSIGFGGAAMLGAVWQGQQR